MNTFFGIEINALSPVGKASVLALAVLYGGLIGFERQWHGNAAGIRTHILVCVGSTLMTLTSVEIGGNRQGDPARIAAQIVSGVGFLGAGAIIREGRSVHGLTTAASIWATAGIGIALGASPHLGELATIATVIVLVTLFALSRLEVLLRLPSTFLMIDLTVTEGEIGVKRVLEVLAEKRLSDYSIEAKEEREGGKGAIRLRLRVPIPVGFDRNGLTQRLSDEALIVSFRLE